MTEQLTTLLKKQFAELLDENGAAIVDELRADASGKLTVSTSFKLTLVLNKLFSNGDLAFSRRFKSSVEGSATVEDPRQPGLAIDLPKRGKKEEAQ